MNENVTVCKSNAVRLIVLCVAACLIGMAALAVAPEQAEAASAANKKIFSCSTYADAPKTKVIEKYDITGDKKADTIKIKAVERTEYNRGEWLKLSIYVNGKKVKTFNDYGHYFCSVKYVRTSSGHPFLYITYIGDNDDGVYGVYQYKKGTLKKIVSNTDMPAAYSTGHRHIDKVRAVGKQVKVRFAPMTYTCSEVEATFTYKWKNKTLKRTSDKTGKVKLTLTNSSTYTALCSRTLRTKPGAGTVAGTVSEGEAIQLKAVCVKGGKMYFKIAARSGATGWMKGFTSSDCEANDWNTFFVGTFLAG